MASLSLRQENIHARRGDVIFLIRCWQFFKRIITGGKTNDREIAEFEKAVRTLRLAAEPGEPYASVAARIAQEAAIYRNFLHHPQPIGKISLIVKELDPSSRDFTSPRKQFQVHDPSEGQRDPAEGCASLGYKFYRSATKVLEFVVHDVDDSPLFAIVRTYSNWLGTREFGLGLNRVFYLNMVEDSPGYVRVHAEFKAVTKKEYATNKPKILEPVQQPPAPVVSEADTGSRVTTFRPFGNRLAYGLLQCAVILFICSSFFCVATLTAMSKDDLPVDQASTVSVPAGGSFTAFTGEVSPFYTMGGSTLVGRGTTNGNIRIRWAQKAKRLSEVKAFRVSVDNNSCKSMESRCLEVLSTVQKGVQTSLSSLSVPVYTLGQRPNGTEPAKLVISYNPIDLMRGQIHLTLYDHEGALWKDDGSISYAEMVEPAMVSSYCEEASSKIVWEIIAAKAQVTSTVGEKGAETLKTE